MGRAAAETDARGGGEVLGSGCGPAVGRRCVRGAAARVVYGGEHLEGFRCCVGLASAVEEWVDVPASPPLAECRFEELAKALRRFPWMVEVVRRNTMGIFHPYIVNAYVARDGSEACLSLNPPKAFCARDGAVREVMLESRV